MVGVLVGFERGIKRGREDCDEGERQEGYEREKRKRKKDGRKKAVR